MESPHGLPAQRLFRPQYVEGVHIRRVHIYLCRDAAGAEPFDIADSLRIKRFPLAYKAIGGRQPGKIRQPRRGGIGGKIRPILPPQVAPLRKVVLPRVPHPAMVVAGAFRVPIVQHGVSRHLKRKIDRTGIPRPDAHRRRDQIRHSKPLSSPRTPTTFPARRPTIFTEPARRPRSGTYRSSSLLTPSARAHAASAC